MIDPLSGCGGREPRRRTPVPPAESPALPQPPNLRLQGLDLREPCPAHPKPATKVNLGLNDPTPHRLSRPRLDWQSWQDEIEALTRDGQHLAHRTTTVRFEVDVHDQVDAARDRRHDELVAHVSERTPRGNADPAAAQMINTMAIESRRHAATVLPQRPGASSRSISSRQPHETHLQPNGSVQVPNRRRVCRPRAFDG
jgi:hypothetical protein